MVFRMPDLPFTDDDRQQMLKMGWEPVGSLDVVTACEKAKAHLIRVYIKKTYDGGWEVWSMRDSGPIFNGDALTAQKRPLPYRLWRALIGRACP